MKHFATLPTEQSNPFSRDLDCLSVDQLIELMVREEAGVVNAVKKVRRDIAAAVRLTLPCLKKGRTIYLVGAGTSGRLCVMEAAECPPSFSTAPNQIQAVMAGGSAAVFRSQEGAEDRALEAERIIRRKVKRGDVVIGVAASGVTPFVLAAMVVSHRKKAGTILITCNPKSTVASLADVVIAPQVGPEVLTGSTRLKAGTATKIVLNTLTLSTMVRWGKVYRHWMVDLQPRSRKLHARALRLIQGLGCVSEERAHQLLRQSRGRVKVAIVMARRGVGAAAARRLLRKSNGFLRRILSSCR